MRSRAQGCSPEEGSETGKPQRCRSSSPSSSSGSSGTVSHLDPREIAGSCTASRDDDSDGEMELMLLLGHPTPRRCSTSPREVRGADSGDVGYSSDGEGAVAEAAMAADRFQRLEATLNKSCVYGAAIREQIEAMAQSSSDNSSSSSSSSSSRAQKRARAEGGPPALSAPLHGGELLPHQLVGARWLLSLYVNGVNGILADDMGLGKTVQTVAFIAELFAQRVFGTHLIVAPLSTLENWRMEFARWAPWVSVTLYHGAADVRTSLRRWLRKRHRNRKNPVVAERMQRDPPQDVAALVGGVVLTSYEMILRDATHLRSLLGTTWRVLVVDEAHRLKNFECALIKKLRTFKVEARVLLTGTPLQNRLAELWSILNFVVPEVFDKLSEFEEWFEFDVQGNCGDEGNSTAAPQKQRARKRGAASSANPVLRRDRQQQLQVVSKMHRVLRPFMLRRTKAEIPSLQLPPKYEVVLHCPMHAQQQQQYDLVRSSARYSNGRLTRLRKLCCHPHLFREFDPFYDDVLRNDGSSHFRDAHKLARYRNALVQDSAKLHMLHRMLPLLRRGGHKVLLFSQFTSNLDIIADYLDHFGFAFLRLDGSTPLESRMQSIAEFSGRAGTGAGTGGSTPFVFLISTRAGGLGLNLVAADTVVLYDCDFNPYNDLQAIDRCHRIGQTRPVVVYRLVCPRTVEEALLGAALRKLRLERLIIGAGRFCDIGTRGGGGGGGGVAAPQAPSTPPDDADDELAALQSIHAQTMAMRFGDTEVEDVSDDVLATLMDRGGVARFCRGSMGMEAAPLGASYASPHGARTRCSEAYPPPTFP